MAYTSTGRPVGRPKTKEYRTISLKIPQTLLDHVQQYARVHRQSMSELIREGLEWRIGEGDPLAQRYAPGERAEQEYTSNTEIPFETERVSVSPHVLQQILDTLAHQDTRLQALVQALEQRPLVAISDAYYSNTTKTPPGEQAHAERSNTVLQEDGDAAVRATAGGQPARPDRAALVARLHQMRARGMSLKAIVDQLRSEGLPTISGKGQWQKGTVDKLLHSQARKHQRAFLAPRSL